ncbi:MAG: hypothetical protein GY822_28610 [Deltaproteobacteria bacterium]|nr:hypothetical protein [Deltaproteobacteria bacterium]
MASASNLGLLLLVLLGSVACDGPEESRNLRIVSPRNLRYQHGEGVVAAFRIEEVSRTPCLHDSALFSVEVRLSEVYSLEGCHYEEQLATTIYADEGALEELATQEVGEEIITLSTSSERVVDALGCSGSEFIHWISPIEDYEPLTKSEMILILRGEHDVQCSSSRQQSEGFEFFATERDGGA